MEKEKFNEKLLVFLKTGTCAFTTSQLLKKELLKRNFQKLEEENSWNLTNGNYFVTRNDASIIAFQITKKKPNGFHLVTSHLDTPTLKIKPKNESFENGVLKINIAPYGGLLNYGWFDRPLSIAGKIIIEKNNLFETKIIDLKEPLLCIPSVAIHLNKKANTNLEVNPQVDLMPIIGLEEEKDVIKNLIKKTYNIPLNNIKDYELFCYNMETPYIIGTKKNILVSPRIDNLTSVFTSFYAFLENDNKNDINVFCSFNHEEIGSLTFEGADSNFLEDILKRICKNMQYDYFQMCANSMVISSDNNHAVHPNHPDYTDMDNKAHLNKGIVISYEMTSSTNALSSSIIKNLCKKKNIHVQEVTTRNDTPSGTTLAGISLSHLSILSIDVGLAQLAMHSSYECIGVDDIYDIYQLFQIYYKTSFQRQEKSTKIIY